MTSHYRP